MINADRLFFIFLCAAVSICSFFSFLFFSLAPHSPLCACEPSSTHKAAVIRNIWPGPGPDHVSAGAYWQTEGVGRQMLGKGKTERSGGRAKKKKARDNTSMCRRGGWRSKNEKRRRNPVQVSQLGEGLGVRKGIEWMDSTPTCVDVIWPSVKHRESERERGGKTERWELQRGTKVGGDWSLIPKAAVCVRRRVGGSVLGIWALSHGP